MDLKNLVKSGNIIKDPTIFQQSFIPHEIFEREETEKLGFALASFIKYRVPTNTLVIGGAGGGKTVTSMYYQNEIKKLKLDKPLDIYYVNCKDYDTSFKIYSKLSINLKEKISKNKVLHVFLKNQKNDCIIILDEINLLRDTDCLYSFSRPHEIEEDFKSSINLILISNNLYWDEILDSATKSSLQLRSILFSNYSTEQLKTILNMRIKIGLKEGSIDEGVLNYLVGKVIKERVGDSRIAISILDHASRKAESKNKKKIDMEEVDEVFEESIKATEIAYINKLDLKSLMILYACSLSKDKKSKNIYEIYKKICPNYGVSFLGYVSFHYYLDYLQSNNLIVLYKLRKGKSFIKEIELKMQNEMILKEVEKRFAK